MSSVKKCKIILTLISRFSSLNLFAMSYLIPNLYKGDGRCNAVIAKTGNKQKIILKPTQVFKNKLSEEPLIRNSAKIMCDCLPQT